VRRACDFLVRSIARLAGPVVRDRRETTAENATSRWAVTAVCAACDWNRALGADAPSAAVACPQAA
jgi:hypothetical protein